MFAARAGLGRGRGHTALLMSSAEGDQPGESKIPAEELSVAPKSSIDWDSEWSKVVSQSQANPGAVGGAPRPEGMEVSEAELALKKLKRQAKIVQNDLGIPSQVRCSSRVAHHPTHAPRASQ